MTKTTEGKGIKYRFLGKPDKLFPSLITGNVYELEIITMSRGLLEWIINKQHPQIISPFNCPYSSWETFYKNWRPIK